MHAEFLSVSAEEGYVPCVGGLPQGASGGILSRGHRASKYWKRKHGLPPDSWQERQGRGSCFRRCGRCTWYTGAAVSPTDVSAPFHPGRPSLQGGAQVVPGILEPLITPRCPERGAWLPPCFSSSVHVGMSGGSWQHGHPSREMTAAGACGAGPVFWGPVRGPSSRGGEEKPVGGRTG